MKKTIICAIVLLVGGLASGTITVVDPDAFSAGTVLNNAFAGVTLSSVGSGWNGANGAVIAVDPLAYTEAFSASTGSLSFGTDDASFPHLFMDMGFLQLRADFDTPVSFVSLDFIGNDSSDTGELLAYDSNDNLIESALTGPLATNEVGTLTISSVSSNIAYILAGGDSGSSSLGLDNLSYIPEPTTICLLGLGGLVLGRRKRA